MKRICSYPSVRVLTGIGHTGENVRALSVEPKLVSLLSGFTRASEKFSYLFNGPGLTGAQTTQRSAAVRASGSLHDLVQFANTITLKAGDT